MLKILQARLQQYVNHELPDVQAGFRKGRRTRDQIANIRWIMDKAREFQKNIYFCFIDYVKAFDCVDHNQLWKILKEMGIPDHLTCLLRNLYAGQEATVRTGRGTTDWFQIGKGVGQGCILSPCLFNLYAEYIMRNAGMEETQAGIKIARRNINNLRFADDTTLMAEREEELKILLIKEKEESENVCLNLNIQNTKIMASGPITSWDIDGETVETVSDFIFLGSQITVDGDCSHEIKRCLLLDRKVMTNLDSILKSRDITLLTKFHLVKAMVFPVVMYGYECWTVKKAVSQSVQSLSRVRVFATPCITACQASLFITISWSSLRLAPIESLMPSSHLILSRPLLLLPPIPPSIRVFSSESTLHMRWPILLAKKLRWEKHGFGAD